MSVITSGPGAPAPARVMFPAIPLPVVLALIPAIFVVAGLLLRYAAYASVASEPSLDAFPDFLCRWDCSWYVKLAQIGYDPFPVPTMINAGNWAFFPLMPMLVGAVRLLTGLPTMTAATGVSIALGHIAARISWPLFANNLRAYTLFSCYLLSGPFSFYFSTFYTEVMFLLLTVAVMVALRRPNYLAAGGLAALLSATRIVGVFMVFAILFRAYEEHRQGGGSWRSFVPAVLRRPEVMLALVIAPLGLFAYMAFLHFWIGDALAFQHVQRAWGRAVGNPATFLWTALANAPDSGWWPTASQQLAMATITGLVLTGVLFWPRSHGTAVFSLVCLVLPLSAGMASMLRFTAALAPVVVLAMQLLSRWRWLFAIALLGFLLADYYVTIAWIGSKSLSLV